MIAELVHRLSVSGVLSRETLAEALFESSKEGVHLLHALATRDSSVLPAIEAELARIKCASIPGPLAIDFIQVLRLPVGLCKRLLAVPLQVDPTNSRWSVAAADPADRHVAAEISYHLGGPVDVFRASISVMVSAVAMTDERPNPALPFPLLDAAEAEEHTPAFGSVAMMPPRRSSMQRVAADTHASLRPTPRRGLSLPPLQNAELQSEPPIPLVRPLAPRAHEEAFRVHGVPRITATLPPKDPDLHLPRLELSPIASTPQERIGDILAELEQRLSARDVLEGFADAVALVAERCAVFAVRAGQFHLEAVLPARLQRQLSVGFDKSGVLNTACLAGYYLGRLAKGADADTLATALDVNLESEIYAVPVVVAERPAAVIVAGSMENTFAATQFIDKIASRGGAVLEKMIQRRRQKR